MENAWFKENVDNHDFFKDESVLGLFFPGLSKPEHLFTDVILALSFQLNCPVDCRGLN